MFFSYANLQHSQKRHCYQFLWDMLFQECFWSRSINSRVVFYRDIKPLGFAWWLYIAIKHSREFIKHYINHKGATLNSLKISEMSLKILSWMLLYCRQAHLVKKYFSRYNHPHILRMCSNHHREMMSSTSDIEISGKTQNYCLKSVCNFKVTRFSLSLFCNNIIGLLGTYSIEIYLSYIFNSLYYKANVCRLPFFVNVTLDLFIVKLLTRIEYVIPG